MSKSLNSFSSPLNDEVFQSIEELNLPIVQKLHIRLLAHCLAIFKEIQVEDDSSFSEEILLKKWCKKQSQKINDNHFNEILYNQMYSASKKLNSFAKSIGKTIQELNLQDLIKLTKEIDLNGSQ